MLFLLYFQSNFFCILKVQCVVFLCAISYCLKTRWGQSMQPSSCSMTVCTHKSLVFSFSGRTLTSILWFRTTNEQILMIYNTKKAHTHFTLKKQNYFFGVKVKTELTKRVLQKKIYFDPL